MNIWRSNNKTFILEHVSAVFNDGAQVGPVYYPLSEKEVRSLNAALDFLAVDGEN